MAQRVETAPVRATGAWPLKPIRELADSYDHIRRPVKEADRRCGPFPYYGASGIVDHVDAFLFDGEYLLVAEDGENLRTLQTPIAFMAKGQFWVNNHAHVLRANAANDTRFLMYSLRATDISGYLSGSTMPKLTKGSLERVPVPAPTLAEQRAIAHILGTLDDKIELNRRMNETLEAMARALFKSWFVDFDPVRAKAAGKQPAGMDAATAALFPSEFVDSEIGMLPKGWRAARLGETYTWSRDGIDPADSPTALFEHFSLPAFDAGRSPTIDLGATIKSLKFLVAPDSVLVSKLNPAISRVWLPFPSGRGTAISSTEFLVAVANTNVPRSWLCGVFLSEPIREAMISQASGTSNSHQRVRPDDIDAIPVALGDSKLLSRYDAIAKPLHDKSNGLRCESGRLAQIRDALLPRLLSGELRIPDVDRVVESAT